MNPEFRYLEDNAPMPHYEIECVNGHASDVYRTHAQRLDPCPICASDVNLLWRSKGACVIGDDVPGGFVVENGFSEPQKFYSKSAHRKALAANGNMLCDWHRGDHDKTFGRMDAVDLEKAKALVSRNQPAYKDEVKPAPPGLIKALKDEFYRP